MISRKLLFIFLLLTFAYSGAKVGTAIFRWAEIETGTRAIGMAGSQVASGNDISALPYNPASICFIAGSYNKWVWTNINIIPIILSIVTWNYFYEVIIVFSSSF